MNLKGSQKVNFNRFSWKDFGNSNRVNWQECVFEMVIDDSTINLNIIHEEYFDDEGDGKGDGIRVIDNITGKVLYNELWDDWSRFNKVDEVTNDDWKIRGQNGIDIWNKIDQEIGNDNGWGFWSVDDVDEEYIKGLNIEIE